MCSCGDGKLKYSNQQENEIGSEMLAMATTLFPLNRSLTGAGNRDTLKTICKMIPELEIHETPSGTPVGDWIIPKEWKVRDAYIIDLSSGIKVVDFSINNLHLVGYSVPIDTVMNREELDPHLYSLPNQPEAIPYVTSYYKQSWGFCMKHKDRLKLTEGPFRIVIDSDLFDGSLTHAELVLPGLEQQEILITTYLCHPSMANDIISGIVIWSFLVRYLQTIERRYTYRFYIGPETIGAINYINLSKNKLKNVCAGWVLTCIGDNGPFSYLKSRASNSLSDRVGVSVVKSMSGIKSGVVGYKIYEFLDRGSDERQFCSPGIDLPIGSFMRSKHGTYPTYHTSLDNLNVLSASSLEDSLNMMKQAIKFIENNEFLRLKTLGEPFMTKYGLRATVSSGLLDKTTKNIMDSLAFMDGVTDLLQISDTTGISMESLIEIAKVLIEHKIVEKVDHEN